MDYTFPVIRHIDEIRPAIKDRNEFIIAEREWGHVINYMVNMTDTFNKYDEYYAFRRECRGLKFDREGNLLARPYHKFFNVGEKDETQIHNIDLSKPHIILEKLDGSMIHPIWVDKESGHWRLCTKMGITDVSMQAEEWLARDEDYKFFIKFCLQADATPIFEWCSRKNRIVLDYPEDRLVLTAVRINRDGKYISYTTLEWLAKTCNIDLVKTYAGTYENMQHLVEMTRELKDQEGFIIRFDDGHMLKIKADDYVKIHKSKDNIRFEKNVISLIIDEKMDDVISFLPEEDAERIQDFIDKFWVNIEFRVDQFEKAYMITRLMCAGDRKTFAIKYAPDTEPFLKSYCFARWDKADWSKQDTHNFIINLIRKKLGSQSGVDEVRYLFYNLKYDMTGGNNE
jgi:RNA ligase